MALTTCTECKAEISDTASACPKCGAPRKPKKKTSAITWIAAVIAGFWLIGYLGSLSRDAASTNAGVSTSVLTEKEQTMNALSFEFSWTRGGFDTVLELNATIHNKSKRGIKDFEISCTGSGASGTRIDKNDRTFYEVVTAGEKKHFPKLSMGFLDAQVKTLACSITDFKLI